MAFTICRMADLGLSITDAAIGQARTRIWCAPVVDAVTCPSCGRPGRVRDHLTRDVVDVPICGAATLLHVRVARCACDNPDCPTRRLRCRLGCTEPRSKVTCRVAGWLVKSLAHDNLERVRRRPSAGTVVGHLQPTADGCLPADAGRPGPSTAGRGGCDRR